MVADALPLDATAARRWQRQSFVAGVVGLALLGFAWLFEGTRPVAARSYLWAFNFWLGIAVGSLALAMLQHLTGGVWGLILRRILEAASRTLPLLAVLFVPLLFAISDLYVWADAEIVAGDDRLQEKTWYLTSSGYVARAVFYFTVWIVLGFFVNRWSIAQDRPDAPTEPRHLRMLSAGGLAVYALTITFAAIDWVMSLEPHWYSSIFGPLFGMGQVLSAFSFATVVLILLANRRPLDGILGRAHFRDLGSLLLAFVMVWAYLGFSQYLLIWSGNLPTENPYYLRRMQGGWQYLAIVIVLVHFLFPFVVLLSGNVKRTSHKLLTVAALVLVMRMLDLYWMVAPAQPGADGRGFVSLGDVLSWTDIAAPIGVGGIWVSVFLGQLQRRPILPQFDPQLSETLHHE